MTRNQLYREWVWEGGRTLRPGGMRHAKAKRGKEPLKGKNMACVAKRRGTGRLTCDKNEERVLQEQ